MYNQVTSVCWVYGSPSECGNSNHTPSDTPCDRGDWAWLFGILLFYGPLWFCVILTIVCMTMIYLQIRNTFQKSEHYQFDSSQAQDTSLSSRRTNTAARSTEMPSLLLPPGESRERAMSNRISPFSVWSPTKGAESGGELQVDMSQAAKDDDAAADHPTEINKDPNDDLNDLNIRQKPQPHRAHSVRKGYRIGFSADCNGCTDKETSERRSRWVRITNRTRTRNQRKQNLFAAQAIMYSVSFFITWMPSTIWSISHWFGTTGIGYDLAAVTCEPLQGLWNLLIFIRSRPRSQAKLARVFGKCFCLCLDFLPKLPDEEAVATNSDGFDSSTGSRAAKSASRQSFDHDSHISDAELPSVAREVSVPCNTDLSLSGDGKTAHANLQSAYHHGVGICYWNFTCNTFRNPGSGNNSLEHTYDVAVV